MACMTFADLVLSTASNRSCWKQPFRVRFKKTISSFLNDLNTDMDFFFGGDSYQVIEFLKWRILHFKNLLHVFSG